MDTKTNTRACLGGDIHYTVIFNSIYARELGYNTFFIKIDLNGI
jgi:hypothetical protein